MTAPAAPVAFGHVAIKSTDLPDGYTSVFDTHTGTLHIDPGADVGQALAEMLPYITERLRAVHRPALAAVVGGGQSTPRRAALRLVQGAR